MANRTSASKQTANSGKSKKKKTTNSTTSKTNRTKRKAVANKSSASTIRKKRSAKSESSRNVVFCVTLILSVFVFLCLINVIKEPLGTAVKGFFNGAFGVIGYIIPFILFLGTWFIIANKDNILPFSKILGLLVVLSFTGSFLSLISKNDIELIVKGNSYIKDLFDGHTGGGVVFGIISVFMVEFLGKTGAIILNILILIIGISCLLGKSLIDLFSVLFGNLYTKLSQFNNSDDNDYDEEEYDIYSNENEDSYFAAEEKNSSRKNKVNKVTKNKDNFFKDSTINSELDNRNDIKNEINNDSPINANLKSENEEKQNIFKEAQESLKNKIEEETRLKKERENEKLKQLDMKDDERILSSSPINSNNIINTTSNDSKDDVHLINVIPEEVEESKQQNYAQTSLYENQNKINRSSSMQEIFYDGLSVDADTHPLNDLIGETNNNIDINRIPESGIDSININRYLPEESEENTNNTDFIHESNNCNATFSDSQLIDNNIKNENNKKSGFDSRFEGNDNSVLQINDTPAEIPESVIKGISINPLENVYDNDIELVNMPDPVTERSHIKEKVKSDQQIKKVVHDRNKYKFPDINLLKKNTKNTTGDTDKELKETALLLQNTLKTFGVTVTVNNISQGPTVTRYELSLGEGIKVNKIVSLTDDIKLNLAAEDIRIEAPIPGKAAVGIEVPNKVIGSVLGRDLLESGEFKNAKSNLAFAVGKDITGKTIVEDIAKMPHLLIAGSTGSGKSVCINTLIMSLLYKAHPDDVKLIMVDPKVVELSVYNGIPHLCLPVVTDPKKASATLKWAVKEMDERYNDFSHYNVRDLKGFNDKAKSLKDSKNPDAPEPKPQIVIIVDELADLMMAASKEVEESICRLAQKARAAGIHLVIATQRPSVDVITGLIKANMPSRIAFKVSSGTDSRTILDMIGAERLLGKGDMLFYPQGFSKPLRVQGAYISDEEVSAVVEELKNQNMDYVVDDVIATQIDGLGQEQNADSNENINSKENDIDSYFKEACRFVVDKGSASSGMLQRVYRVGYNRAARMIDKMESVGIVSGEKGTKPRDILVDNIQLEEILSHL